ncbi:MAG: hypothetical protein JNM66_00075 [Bryobacterales bacterium]|nr:hypothetical protein [Bryobacterales bacterium]
MTTRALLLLAALSVAAQPATPPAWTAGAKVAPATVGATPNSAAFGNRIYFAGQPSQADLAEYAKLGVKTIVNLRMPAETASLGFDEAAAVKAAGMNYVSVPFGPVMPPDGDLAKIYAELNKAGDGKVLLHCASSNRAGMVWAVYRGTQHALPAEAAIAEGKAAGLKAAALEKLAREKLAGKP